MSVRRVGIAVVEHEGRFLVGIRPPRASWAGYSEFPGGKCEGTESAKDAAVRECLEETGLQVTAIELLRQSSHPITHGTLELHFWKCKPVSPDAVRDDHQGFLWRTRNELRHLRFPEANGPVIALLCREAG
jgi:8-oxo-dGTP diphosphatase